MKELLFGEGGGSFAPVAGAILFFFCGAGLSFIAGILMIVSGLNQPGRDTSSGRIAIGVALVIFGVIAVPLAYILLNYS